MRTPISPEHTDSKIPRYFYLALLSVGGAIIVLLTIGTIFAIARPSGSGPILTLGNSGKNRQAALSPASSEDIRVFSGLGRLRVPLANSSTLILSIAFPYSVADVTFTEELAGKVGDFRVIASGYFSALPADSLIHIDEEAAKQEILKRYNAALRLGRIEALYFSDMMVIDGSL